MGLEAGCHLRVQSSLRFGFRNLLEPDRAEPRLRSRDHADHVEESGVTSGPNAGRVVQKDALDRPGFVVQNPLCK